MLSECYIYSLIIVTVHISKQLDNAIPYLALNLIINIVFLYIFSLAVNKLLQCCWLKALCKTELND